MSYYVEHSRGGETNAENIDYFKHDQTPLDEHGVLEQVLGMRRGHKIGVGPMLSQKHYSGASPSSVGSYSDATSSAQPDLRVSHYLKKSYREQMKIYDNQVKMLELVSKLQPNIQLPVIDRPEPVDLDALDLPSSDDDSPNDDSGVDDATNLDDQFRYMYYFIFHIIQTFIFF